MKIMDRIIKTVSEKKWKIKILPIKYLNNLKSSLKKTYQIMGNTEFKNFIDRCFDFNAKELLNSAKSVIIIGMPSPKIYINIKWNNTEKKLIIPPTYVDIRSGIDKAEKLLSQILVNGNCYLKRIKIPEKLLAVHSGLGKYGRNNICYVDEIGSFCRLVSFISNLQPVDFVWNDIKLMESCNNCSICIKRCPTGAIREDRILINGGKCLTYFNESPGAFPGWIDKSVHHSLVGCLFCQDKCPQNDTSGKDLNEYEFESFDENELFSIMNTEKFDMLAPAVKSKLIKLNMDIFFNVLPRNLKVLF